MRVGRFAYRALAFPRFAVRFGVATLAREVGPVHENAVYQWIQGRHAPRIEHAQRIVQLSHRRLALEQVYEPYLRRHGLAANPRPAEIPLAAAPRAGVPLRA